MDDVEMVEALKYSRAPMAWGRMTLIKPKKERNKPKKAIWPKTVNEIGV